MFWGIPLFSNITVLVAWQSYLVKKAAPCWMYEKEIWGHIVSMEIPQKRIFSMFLACKYMQSNGTFQHGYTMNGDSCHCKALIFDPPHLLSVSAYKPAPPFVSCSNYWWDNHHNHHCHHHSCYHQSHLLRSLASHVQIAFGAQEWLIRAIFGYRPLPSTILSGRLVLFPGSCLWKTKEDV